MDNDQILNLVKASLGYKSNVRDELFKVIIQSIIDELEIQKNIKIDYKNSEQLMFIVDLAVFRYNNQGGSIMPRNLEYRLRNLIIKYGGGVE